MLDLGLSVCAFHPSLIYSETASAFGDQATNTRDCLSQEDMMSERFWPSSRGFSEIGLLHHFIIEKIPGGIREYD
jgi:hypothetical protein